MFTYKSKSIVSAATIAAAVIAFAGCRGDEVDRLVTTSLYSTVDAPMLRDASTAGPDNAAGSIAQGRALAEHHFDIYKRYHAISDAAAARRVHDADGVRRIETVLPARGSGRLYVCSLQALVFHDWLPETGTTVSTVAYPMFALTQITSLSGEFQSVSAYRTRVIARDLDAGPFHAARIEQQQPSAK
jgi:hypothetical protein